MKDELIATPEIPALTGLALATIRAYRNTEPDFPAVVRKIGNVNFFKKSDLIAWNTRHAKRKEAFYRARRGQRA